MTTAQPWDLASIRSRYEQGATIAELAGALGISRESVRRAMAEAGITRRPRGNPVGKHRPSGGRIRDGDGYLLVRLPDHPSATRGYVREHRLVMEGELGRYLAAGEVVAHLNGMPDDNRPENLRVYGSSAAFSGDALKGNQRAKGDLGNPKRSHRVIRSPEQILRALVELRESLGRDIRRSDLRPPNPSYRAVARAFGSWRNGVALALKRLEDEAMLREDVAPVSVLPVSRSDADGPLGATAA